MDVILLFDLDGTLTDSGPGIMAAARIGLAAVGVEQPDQRVLQSFVGPPLQEAFLQAGIQPDQIPAAIAAFREYYWPIGLFENEVYDGIPQMLAELSGHRLAVATSKPEPMAHQVLERFGIAHHFEYVAGALLDGTRRHKADVIAHAVAQLGARADYMIGDREHDALGAAAHDIAAIGVAWGYGSADELLAAGVEFIVQSPQELVSSLSRIG